MVLFVCLIVYSLRTLALTCYYTSYELGGYLGYYYFLNGLNQLVLRGLDLKMDIDEKQH